jgi:CDP-paratose 2-epimerase
VCDAGAVRDAVRDASAVFHLAGQVAVTTSLEHPMQDVAVNLLGTMNVLEAARRRPRPPALVFTSTNKVYGSLGDVALIERRERYEPADGDIRSRGIGERRPLHFCTPYGCSKGAADQYVLDYAASYGLPSVVFRMSCIYGPHQCGTEDQGWIAHFLISAVTGRGITLYGDGRQVRDILYVDDLIDAFLLARNRAAEIAGTAFNIGGGPANAISLLEVIEAIGRLRGERPRVRHQAWRAGDQRYYVSDTSRFEEVTAWRPRIGAREGLERLHAWLAEQRAPATAGAAA